VSLVSERPLVLLVEDDRDGRRLLAELLLAAGFRVEQAHNGMQALERARDLPIPVAAMTGYAPFTQDPARAERAGCAVVLCKPCDPDMLAETLTALIMEARGRRSA